MKHKSPASRSAWAIAWRGLGSSCTGVHFGSVHIAPCLYEISHCRLAKAHWPRLRCKKWQNVPSMLGFFGNRKQSWTFRMLLVAQMTIKRCWWSGPPPPTHPHIHTFSWGSGQAIRHLPLSSPNDEPLQGCQALPEHDVGTRGWHLAVGSWMRTMFCTSSLCFTSSCALSCSASLSLSTCVRKPYNSTKSTSLACL